MEGKRVVKVMWDYEAYPLWVAAGRLGQASSRGVPVSVDLAADLQSWSDNMTSLIWGRSGPDTRKWDSPDIEALSALNSEGRALAQRVRAELSDEWKVEYFDEETDEVNEVLALPRPVQKRHGGRY